MTTAYTTRRYASAVYAIVVSVHPTVRLSQAALYQSG